MKLSKGFAKLTSVKSNVVRILAAATLAGAALMVAAPKAEAQHVAFGVQFGSPAYYAPVPRPYYSPYDHYRWERERERIEAQRRFDEMRAREAFRFRHEEFRHDDRGFYRR